MANEYMVKPTIRIVKYLARDIDNLTWVQSSVPAPIINELLHTLNWTIDEQTNELTSTNMRISLRQLQEVVR